MVTQPQIEGLPPAPPSEREQYQARCLDAIRELAESEGEFTADEVRGIAGPPPDRYITGRVFRQAKLAGLIRPSHTYTLSRTGGRRRAPVMVWYAGRTTA
ncbi:hypothetical protein [Kocuria sp.]|uniref:hypothetical protein n=1 Tax=Kocuria sp. TaxID=1871328 RepID=UPI0026DBF662|nr:hypothetical protein [Kocuria sp.]MDO4920053.1 hypothetical protein [Kocuria sp.]